VDKCYRREIFTSERQRVEFLFALYEELTAPRVAAGRSKRRYRPQETVYPAPYPKPPPSPHPGPTRAQAEADAAHFYFIKEETPATEKNRWLPVAGAGEAGPAGGHL